MNAHTSDFPIAHIHASKEELALSMPSSLSHYFKDDAAYESRDAARPGLTARIAAGLRWLAALPTRHATMNELQSLSEHELADIGLSRSELSRVFDPDFTSARSARGFGRSNINGYISIG